jgi:hypothetical protein
LVEFRLVGELAEHLGPRMAPLQRVDRHDRERQPGGALQRREVDDGGRHPVGEQHVSREVRMDELIREVNRSQRGQHQPHLTGKLPGGRAKQRTWVSFAPRHLIADHPPPARPSQRHPVPSHCPYGPRHAMTLDRSRILVIAKPPTPTMQQLFRPA